MSENKSLRITKNTTFLYIRLLFLLIINLISVRLLLDTLGESDYGLYNVVAGIVTMLSFVTTALQTSTQRYYSYYLGESNGSDLRKVFSASLEIYILFAIVVIVLGESLGLWFINNQLNIPSERMVAANYIYQFSIVSFALTILSLPYSSAVIANEDMNIYAAISISEGVLKLSGAIILYYVPAHYDKLILYGLFLLLINSTKEFTYIYLARKRYTECHYVNIKRNEFRKPLSSFAGWTMYGQIAGMLNNQGNTILVNRFFGTIVNASRAVSLQISSAIYSFCGGFITAIKPPIVKSYVEGDYAYMFKVFYFGNKFLIYSLLIITIPFFFEMETILKLWLKNVTADMIVFSRLVLLYTIIILLHEPITILIQAIGNVKKYYLLVDTISLLSLPLTYAAFKGGFSAQYNYYVMILVFALAHIVRLALLRHNFRYFSIKSYLLNFFAPAIIVLLSTSMTISLFRSYINNEILRLFLTICISTILIITIVYAIILNKNEKLFLKRIVQSFMGKMKQHQ